MRLSITEAAHHCKVARSTLHRWIARGALAPYIADGLLETDPPGRDSLRRFVAGFRGQQGPRRRDADRPVPPPTAPEVPVMQFGLWGPEPDSWGGWRPDEVLDPDGELLHALAMALGLAGLDIPDASVAEAAECLPRCLQAVAAGGRWDREVWTRRLIETALDGLEDGGADDVTRAELEGYRDAGRVPADLLPEVHRALGTGSD